MKVLDSAGKELRVGDRVVTSDGREGTVFCDGYRRVRVGWEPPDPVDGEWREFDAEPVVVRTPDLLRVENPVREAV